jgi:TolB-like protein/tetratricopeptide (TPR) repeat protein
VSTHSGCDGARLGYTAQIVGPHAAQFPNSIDRYRIDSRIGAGGMGEVYRATDPKLGRSVAIKTLPARLAAEPARLERFEREARAASSLNHPNIVTVYDAGVSEGVPWIAMELVEGRTLRSAVADGPMPPDAVLRIAMQVADGLRRAHEAGIVHRDLKPENVMATSGGVVKILDFGVAKLTGADEPASETTETTQFLTAAGVVVGTPSYMSPEQVTGRPVDHRSDQFAFGVLLYEMLTGANPFQRATPAQMMAAIVESEPKPATALNPALPDRLAAVIARCMAKQPADRFADMREAAAALGAAPPSAPAGLRRRAGWIALAAIAASVVGASVAVGWRSGRPAQAAIPVVAVRPFKTLADASKEYVGSGLSEEIRGQLSKISSIRLLSRGAVERYGDGDDRRLAAELGVGKVVGGTVRIENDRVRVSVQLTDAKTEQTIWAEQYDRPIVDILGVESDVAVKIASALQTTLTTGERRRVGKRPTENAAAYELYLQARRIGRGNLGSAGRAIGLLQEAVRLDPKFAAAMAELTYRLLYIHDPAKVGEAMQWAQRAIATDPELADGYVALAFANGSAGSASKARAAFLKAIELDPNRAATMQDLANLTVDLGNFEEALHWARLALEREPKNPSTYSQVAAILSVLGDRETNERWMRIWRERTPRFYRVPMNDALLAITAGRPAEAAAIARKLFAANRNNLEYRMLLADTLMAAGDADAEQINREVHAGAPDPTWLNWIVLPESPRVRYAYFAQRRGERAEATKLLEEAERVADEAFRRGVETPLVAIEMAAIRALRQDSDGAMKWLQRAYDRGWRIRESNLVDPMLAGLRGDARFGALMSRIESDVLRMRKESTELRDLFNKTVPALPPVTAFTAPPAGSSAPTK